MAETSRDATAHWRVMGDDEETDSCVWAYRAAREWEGGTSRGERGELLRRVGKPPPTGAARGTIKVDGKLAKVVFSFCVSFRDLLTSREMGRGVGVGKTGYDAPGCDAPTLPPRVGAPVSRG